MLIFLLMANIRYANIIKKLNYQELFKIALFRMFSCSRIQTDMEYNLTGNAAAFGYWIVQMYPSIFYGDPYARATIQP